MKLTVKYSLVFTACSLLLLVALASALAVQPKRNSELADYDVRIDAGNRSGFAAVEHREALSRLKAKVEDVRVDWDELSGTPKWVISRNGFLTGPNGEGRAVSETTARTFPSGDPHRAAKSFLNEHSALFDHDAAELQSAPIVREFTTAHNQMRTVVWQQQEEGIPVFRGLLVAHISRREELVSLSSGFIPNPKQAVSQGHPGRPVHPVTPEVSVEQAITQAGANIGEDVKREQVYRLSGQTSGPFGYQTYAAPALCGEAYARRVWLPLDHSRLRLCWEIILTSRQRNEMFRVLIDAENGHALLRQNLTCHLEPVSYRVFTNDSPTPLSPGWSTPLTNQPCPPCGDCSDCSVDCRPLVTLVALSTNASPNGWINDGVSETRGNNVAAYLDRNSDNLPDGPWLQGSNYRVFDFPLNRCLDPTTYGEASVVQLFYWCNWMHDRLYELGFTEAAGNLQGDNFERGGLGNDALLAEAQDGADTNNSRFFTTPDGVPPRMEIYLWDRMTPRRDAALDAEIILHEYTHGLSSRRIGGGIEPAVLQTRGLAEGWSDFYSLALLSRPGQDLSGAYPIGAYVALWEPAYRANYYFGIRRYPYSTDTNKFPLTFKDIDTDQAGDYPLVPRNPFTTNNPDYAPNVPYSLGELWCETLWEMRANMINQYGFAAGNQLALQLVTDALDYTPADATFLQARDALLLADRAGYGSAHFYDIWSAFAKRGMGYSAASPPSSTTMGVHEAFDVPDTLSISPQTGLVASGPVGGPFNPAFQSYTLTNIWTNNVTWAALNNSVWLSLSQTGGTLAPAGPAATVTVSVNEAANSLAAGVYTNTVCFTNLGTGASMNLKFVLRVGQPDFFTELFGADDNDLDYRTFTFTPDGSDSFYTVCQTVATNFPTDPAEGTPVSLTDESYAQVTLTGADTVALYNRRTNVFFIGSNGYLTFGSGDPLGGVSLTNHFSRLRVSALYDDLDPGAGGSVSWEQFSDRVAVTFLNVPEYYTTNSNSFQIELFFDGTIRLTYLGIAARDGLIGLSRGLGLPPNFLESDFSAYGICLQPLALTLPSSATEGDSPKAGQVTIFTPAATNLTVLMTSANTSAVMTPPSVTILAGNTNVTFYLTNIDNSLLDGTRSVPIMALAYGYWKVTNFITIFDNETATLSVSLPASVSESNGSVTGSVGVSAPPAVDVQVELATSSTNRIRVPAFVVIPAGQTSAAFSATILDNQLIEGPQIVEVTAHVQNWVDGHATMTVQDDETPILRVSLPALAAENDGLLPGAGVVNLTGILTTDLAVLLTTDRPDLLGVPSGVTVPAGAKYAIFDLTILNNGVANGDQSTTVTTAANGFTNGSAVIQIQDDDIPAAPSSPTPPHQSTDISILNSILRWAMPARELVLNGGFESGDFSGWARENNGPGDWYINDGTFDPASPDGPLPPLAGGRFSAISDQTASGKHTLYQQIAIPSSATSVILRWSHRLRNFAGIYATNQQFRVEIRDVTNRVLAVAYATGQGDPFFSDWMIRYYNLNPFKGRCIRLAFVAEGRLGDFNVHLDGVTVTVAAPDAVTYDVYFGTSASPGAGQWQGSTTNRYWDLPLLSPLTTYHWKVVARRVGQTSSPVWLFTTRGVDHFVWSMIPSPQSQNLPFLATITARDEYEDIVTNYAGPVALSARQEALDPAIGGDADQSPYPLAAAANVARSQIIYRADELNGPQRFTALALQVLRSPGQTLNNWTIRMKHTGLDYFTEPEWESAGWTTVYQHNESFDEGWTTFVFDAPFDYDGNSNLMIDFSFNDSSHSADGLCAITFTVDQRMISCATDDSYGDPLDWNGSSPYPEVGFQIPNIILTAYKAPVAILPMVSGAFENGAWTGQIVVMESGSALTLCANDDRGHSGRSVPFAVLSNGLSRIVQCGWSGADFQIGFTSVTGLNYRVECSPSLAAGSWTPITGTLAGTGGIMSVTNVNAASQSPRFYRATIVP